MQKVIKSGVHEGDIYAEKNSLYFFSQTHRRAAYFCINIGESSLHRSAEHYAIAIPKRVVPVLMTRCKYFLFPPICLLLLLVVCSETLY